MHPKDWNDSSKLCKKSCLYFLSIIPIYIASHANSASTRVAALYGESRVSHYSVEHQSCGKKIDPASNKLRGHAIVSLVRASSTWLCTRLISMCYEILLYGRFSQQFRAVDDPWSSRIFFRTTKNSKNKKLLKFFVNILNLNSFLNKLVQLFQRIKKTNFRDRRKDIEIFCRLSFLPSIKFEKTTVQGSASHHWNKGSCTSYTSS